MAQTGLSFFEHAPEEENPQGVPADLLPYLLESDNDTDIPTTDTDSDEGDNDDMRAAALRALMEHSLLAGPDPSILNELDADEEEWDGVEAQLNEELTHDQALDAAQEETLLRQRVEEIYRGIIERAPEHKIQPSLDRVRAVLDILGDPQNTYPSIHITGTNGKTSTARMVDSLLSALGMRVGRFTSPHLMDVRERISLEGEPISPQGFVAAWEDIAPYVAMVDEKSLTEGGVPLSFFEVFTVMAYAAFADYPVDAAVVEVGMGGQWDATNVIHADVSVITPIDLDHTKWLGATVADIAHEKAGIIKPGQTLIIAKQEHEEVEEILLARAQELDAVVRLEGRDYEVLDTQVGVGGQMITVRTPAATYADIFVPLHGQYQAHNAAAALVAAEALMGGRALDGGIVEQGMMKVTSPGRLEIIRRSPTILVDAAHNPHGARSLVDALSRSFDFTRLVGVYSTMADKDVERVLVEVEPHLDELVITQMPGERAMDIDALFAIATDVFGADRVHSQVGLGDAVDYAVHRAEASDDPATSAAVVVFGSVVLAGELRRLLGLS